MKEYLLWDMEKEFKLANSGRKTERRPLSVERIGVKKDKK
jgi:hypothetical protein